MKKKSAFILILISSGLSFSSANEDVEFSTSKPFISSVIEIPKHMLLEKECVPSRFIKYELKELEDIEKSTPVTSKIVYDPKEVFFYACATGGAFIGGTIFGALLTHFEFNHC